MRQGLHPQIVWADNGEWLAISTGADYCAEHECGSRVMQELLCQGQAQSMRARQAHVRRVRRHLAMQRHWLGKLLLGPVPYGSVLEAKRINRNLQRLVLVEGQVDGQTAALLVFEGSRPRQGLSVARLTFDKQGLYGAWDEESFSFAVRGAELVPQLKRFHQRLQAQEGLFAGTFLKASAERPLSGVIIALEPNLRARERQALERAQLEWEDSLRLKALSRLDELYRLLNKQRRASTTPQPWLQPPGHLWPVWSSDKSEVLYALNPSGGVQAPYYGPYPFEQLLQWCLSPTKFELTPVSRVPA